jgi:hypothetical protein
MKNQYTDGIFIGESEHCNYGETGEVRVSKWENCCVFVPHSNPRLKLIFSEKDLYIPQSYAR